MIARRRFRADVAAWAWLALIVPSASCVPAGVETDLRVAIAAPEAPGALPTAIADQSLAPGLGIVTGNSAFAANAAIPISSGPNPIAATFAFEGRTPLDRLRSHDCLSQAIYYEARSESEDGQRAVAQVVLNRVRHPAWPNSVCGVVYQGPMRPGGGCQFTFTCDGSLRFAAGGPGWDRARRLAAEALAGRVFAPVGLSTHYHTHAVFPAWAPRLVKTAVIGAHNFYRLPGLSGAPGAFADSYAGSEPQPRPTMMMAFARDRNAAGDSVSAFEAAALPPSAPIAARPAPPPSDIPQDPRWTAANLPESTIREEYRQSGQWRADAPASVTGAR